MSDLKRVGWSFLIAWATYAALGASASAQCVECKVIVDRFACGAAAKGGELCTTASDGFTCSVIKPCPKKTDPQPGGGPVGKAGVFGKVNLTDSEIRQIARIHPRFALAVTALRTLSARDDLDLREIVSTSVLPAPLSSTDVDSFLAQGGSPQKFLKQMRTRVVKDAPAVVYNWEVTASTYQPTLDVRLSAASAFEGDPPGTVLLASFIRDQDGWRLSQWHVE